MDAREVDWCRLVLNLPMIALMQVQFETCEAAAAYISV